MFKQTITFILLLFILCRCFTDSQGQSKDESYVLNISIKNNNGNTSYLHALSTSPIQIIDSALIIDNKALFQGKVTHPERYLITINSLIDGKMFILENDSIQIIIKDNNLSKSLVLGSKLNDELSLLQEKSKKITSKIDLIFPDIQRARLENNVEELVRISNIVKGIVNENIDFNFDYISKNPNSYISAMILHDLSKRDSISITKLSKYYSLLSKNVKNSNDALKVADILKEQ